MPMAGAEMVDRHPVKPDTEILLHHRSPDDRLEAWILLAVLGREDQARLVAVVGAALEKGLAVDCVRLGAIELAPSTFARRSVPLQIAQNAPGHWHRRRQPS